MNISNPNLISILAATVAGENLNPLLNLESVKTEDFTHVMMEQLRQFTNVEIPEQLNIPLHEIEQLPEETLQEFAEILGNNLPRSTKVDDGIDLEETLATLSEVLQQIGLPVSQNNSSDTLDMDRKPIELSEVIEEEEPVLDVEVEAQENIVLEPPVESFEAVSSKLLFLSQPVQENVKKEMNQTLSKEVSSEKAAFRSGWFSGFEQPVEEIKETKESLIGTEQVAKSLMADSEADRTDLMIKKPKTELDYSANEENFEQKLSDLASDKKMSNVVSSSPVLMNEKLFQRTGPADIPPMTRSINHPQWSQELGERILWMNNKEAPLAELKLNPQHLGPVSIRVKMEQDQATIQFSAHNAAVREAIEAAVPKLREMMGSQQLNLVEVSVSQPSSHDQGKSPGYGQMAQNQQESNNQREKNGTDTADRNDSVFAVTDDVEQTQMTVKSSNGVLNLFA